MAINSVMIIPKMSSNSWWFKGFNAPDHKQLKNSHDQPEKSNGNDNSNRDREYPRDDLFPKLAIE